MEILYYEGPGTTHFFSFRVVPAVPGMYWEGLTDFVSLYVPVNTNYTLLSRLSPLLLFMTGLTKYHIFVPGIYLHTRTHLYQETCLEKNLIFARLV